MPRYGTVDRDYAMRLATCDPAEDGPVYMVNLMKYRERADYGGGGDDGVSGREADDRYAPVDVLAAIGARVCFTGDVIDASEDWDRVGVVRYPTRRSFIEMQSRDDFKEKHVHKDAGMDHTIVLGTLPVDAVPVRAAPRRVLLEVWRDGPLPARASADASTFTVEGTVLGDGRAWGAIRWTPLDDATAVDRTGASADHQVLVLRPDIEGWS